jgi:hypothetical protein
MLHTLTLAALGVTALLPSAAQQSTQEIFDAMRARQLERWETVDNYTVFQSMQGFEIPGLGVDNTLEIPLYYQKHDIDGQPSFGLVPTNEYFVAVAQASEGGEMVNAEAFAANAEGSVMMADALDDEIANSGFPKLPGMNYPGQMMRDNAIFLDASAEGIREAEAGDYGRGDAALALRTDAEMASTLQLVGRAEIDGREAFHLRTEGLNRVVTGPDEEIHFTLRSVSMWIDAEHYVTLKTTMEGDAGADGETRSITLERLLQDYRPVGPLYESHRQVMRMKGIMEAMDPKQREDIEKAQRQMEELEAQLDQMPAAARGMVERQIAKGRAQMEMLTGDSGIEVVSEVLRIEINTGPPPPGTLHKTPPLE